MRRQKIVLIGAGSAIFTKGLIADFIKSDFGEWDIALCDINAEILYAVTRLSKKMIQQKNAEDRIHITSSTDRRLLLPDADFVVTTIAVGGRRAWEQDVLIPRRYGIFQPVGDSVMPGGISRAQRMIPAMIDIARDVKELCPNAYFFNYSNPMTAIVTAVRRETGVDMIGLCHGVIYGERYLSRLLGVDYKCVTTLGAGLNHLTFLFDIRVNGEDAKPRLLEIMKTQREEAEKYGHVYNFFNSQLDDKEIPNVMDNPFSWTLFERYGALPAVLDRHATEFFPERFPKGEYYGHQLGVNAFPIEDVLARGEKTYRRMLEQGEEHIEIDDSLFQRSEGEHEQLVEIIQSLLLDERKSFSVNMPNNGAVKGLDDNMILEIPGVATALGFCPMKAIGFSDPLRALIAKKAAPVEMTVKAALTGNRSYWVEALLLDGSVTDEETARRLVDDFINEHRSYLPQYM